MRILKKNRLLREEIGHSSKADGSENMKQEEGKEPAKAHQRHVAVRTGCWGFPPSPDTSWRDLKESVTSACQGGGDCVQLRRVVGEERCTRRSERLRYAGAWVAVNAFSSARCAATLALQLSITILRRSATWSLGMPAFSLEIPGRVL